MTLNRIGERTEPWGEPFLNLPVQNKLYKYKHVCILGQDCASGLGQMHTHNFYAHGIDLFLKRFFNGVYIRDDAQKHAQSSLLG